MRSPERIIAIYDPVKMKVSKKQSGGTEWKKNNLRGAVYNTHYAI